MTKIVYTTILLLLSYYSYTQEQTPAIEWVEPYNGGTRGGSITTFPGPNVLFALIKAQNSISGSASISKFYADGLVKNQFIFADGGSSNAPAISQYASQDGGVIVYLFLSRTLRKYDAELNLSWQKTVDYSIQNATATLANGFYLLTTTFINNNVSELKRMKNDGSIEWSIDISGLSNIPTDIQTTSDDGVIMATSGGLRKYSVTGQLVWSNTSVLNASQLVITDPSIMYVYTSNSTVIQLNTLNGNANWTKSITGENIIDFERTSDNGCIFSTGKGLYKYNAAGDLQWKNTDYSSAKITTTSDGKIFVIKNNTITKLTFSNEQLWAKSFNSDYYLIQDINGASDFGLYVSAVKNGKYFNSSPDFLLFKLASPETPCKTNFDIIGEATTYCKTGNLNLSSKVSNVSMEYMAFLSNFTFQWQRYDTPIESANNYSYTANKTGNYSLKVKQQGCEASSRSVELNLINEIPPVLEVDKNQICSGASVNISAKGCDGTVVWSTGQRGMQIKVTPKATTAYNALCEKYFNNDLCQSPTSDNITITVLTSSDLSINEINGKKEFCENNFTELKPDVSGGVPPISYAWSKNSIVISNGKNLSANEEGIYILQVSDNIGCYTQSDIIPIKKINNPVVPIIIPPASTILCAKGNVTLTTGSKENSYQWMLNNVEIKDAIHSSYSATSAGSYLLKVTNTNGCSSISQEPVILRASDLQISRIEGKTEFCSRDSTQLTPVITGGVEPFKYTWIRNDTTFSQADKVLIKHGGSYALAIIDQVGCVANSLPLLIKETANPIAPVLTSPSGTEICVNGSVVLTTTAKESKYQWYLNDKEIVGANDQFYTATSPGKYQLKVINTGGCVNMSENTISLRQIVIPQPSINQSNDSLISSATTGNKWYLNGNELPVTSQKIKFTEVGSYQVKVFEKGCESVISANFIPIILANEQESTDLQIYPNPTSDKVFIKSSKAISYLLIDITGKLLNQSTTKSLTHTLDLNRFSSGNYFVILQEENGNSFVRKLSVNR
jgi:hypothetical protein